MAKLVENTFRFINISFVNELAVLCDRLGLNVWQVIDAAATKPFAFLPHYPGPGVGGDCIPVTPLYLAWRAEREAVAMESIRAAKRVNDGMPRLVVAKLARLLAERFAKPWPARACSSSGRATSRTWRTCATRQSRHPARAPLPRGEGRLP